MAKIQLALVPTTLSFWLTIKLVSLTVHAVNIDVKATMTVVYPFIGNVTVKRIVKMARTKQVADLSLANQGSSSAPITNLAYLVSEFATALKIVPTVLTKAIAVSFLN